MAASDRTEPVTMTDEELSAVREDLKKLYDEKPCNPLMVRRLEAENFPPVDNVLEGGITVTAVSVGLLAFGVD